jgi:ABC-type branched-subunit amino acid transport system ATPase component
VNAIEISGVTRRFGATVAVDRLSLEVTRGEMFALVGPDGAGKTTLVQPGSAVMTVGDLTHPYVSVYVSETDLPHIRTGMRTEAVIDGMHGRTAVDRRFIKYNRNDDLH